jgi:hypothetical protein
MNSRIGPTDTAYRPLLSRGHPRAAWHASDQPIHGCADRRAGRGAARPVQMLSVYPIAQTALEGGHLLPSVAHTGLQRGDSGVPRAWLQPLRRTRLPPALPPRGHGPPENPHGHRTDQDSSHGAERRVQDLDPPLALLRQPQATPGLTADLGLLFPGAPPPLPLLLRQALLADLLLQVPELAPQLPLTGLGFALLLQPSPVTAVQPPPPRATPAPSRQRIRALRQRGSSGTRAWITPPRSPAAHPRPQAEDRQPLATTTPATRSVGASRH